MFFTVPKMFSKKKKNKKQFTLENIEESLVYRMNVYNISVAHILKIVPSYFVVSTFCV